MQWLRSWTYVAMYEETQAEQVIEVQIPAEDLEQYIDEAVQSAMEAAQDTAVTDIQLQELAQSSALIALDMAVSEEDSDDVGPAQVQVVLTDEQWQKARTEAQIHNSLLLILVLITAGVFGSNLLSYFVKGWRK